MSEKYIILRYNIMWDIVSLYIEKEYSKMANDKETDVVTEILLPLGVTLVGLAVAWFMESKLKSGSAVHSDDSEFVHYAAARARGIEKDEKEAEEEARLKEEDERGKRKLHEFGQKLANEFNVPFYKEPYKVHNAASDES